MIKQRLINILFVWVLIISTFGISGKASAKSSALLQSGTLVTATGKLSDAKIGFYLSMTFKFNPAGGPVTGSMQGSGSISIPGSGFASPYTAIGTLTGNFEGGDGGRISGDATYTVSEPNQADYTNDNNWEGTLNADGTGSGQMVYKKNGALWGTWTVTFSAQEFQAALVPIPMLASFPTETPASADEAVNLVGGFPTVVVKTWPELDAAIAEILNQDDAIVARDEQGVYSVVDNQGNQKALPAEMQSVLQMNNEFGLLQNANLLWASSAVQAFVAANGNGAMDAITGSGNYQYFTIPEWLKQRQYLKVTTQCEGGNCSPYTTISVLQSSLHFNPQALASSEHSSIRGTINGGGDFIYNPFPANGVELASLFYVPWNSLQNAGSQPYLGVQVLNATDRAYIQMVQQGSPADEAGLAVDDQIVSVSGAYLDDSQNTLAALIGQHSGGDQVELGVIRLGESDVTPVTVTLATLGPPVIVTPSAEITVSDSTEFVVDIGLNGVTGVLVLADTAHVREPVTGSEVDVPAGSVVIVVPGYEIGNPIQVKASDITAWWNGEQQPTPVPPAPGPGPSPTPVDSTWLYIILAGCCCVIVITIVVVVVIVLVTRKKKQSLAPTSYPPQR